MDMQEFFQDRRNQAMFGGSVLFMLIFPIYFALVPSLVGLDDAGVSDASGTWAVSFTEESFIQIEDGILINEGDTHESNFMLTEEMIGENRNVASVTIEVSCNDNDDVPPTFNDGGSGESDLAGVSGELQDQSASGNCGGDNAFSMTWNIIEGYDGVPYEVEGQMSDIIAQWSDNESARGDWLVGITADINSNPFQIIGQDDSEDYDITWTALVFEMSMEPVLNIDDPTTE
ncbi:MAG: hypothetical protein ACJZ59_07580 [Candidatus Thalassarchaeaceae archaeon]